jgi:hypothetical protein
LFHRDIVDCNRLILDIISLYLFIVYYDRRKR